MLRYPSLTISGFLGGDAEVKTLDSGKRLARFSLAMTAREKVDGRYENGMTMWIDCTAWDYLIPQVEGLKRGDLVCLIGDISPKQFSTKAGAHKQALDMTVRSFIGKLDRDSGRKADADEDPFA
jgi:single-strand DNA-binding protein